MLEKFQAGHRPVITFHHFQLLNSIGRSQLAARIYRVCQPLLLEKDSPNEVILKKTPHMGR